MAVTLTIEPDEFLGLSALADLGQTANGGGTGTDAVTQAKTLVRRALADKLEDAGLPWAPSAVAVKRRAAEAAEPDTAIHPTVRPLSGGHVIVVLSCRFPSKQASAGTDARTSAQAARQRESKMHRRNR